jgi:hypothetical protein
MMQMVLFMRTSRRGGWSQAPESPLAGPRVNAPPIPSSGLISIGRTRMGIRRRGDGLPTKVGVLLPQRRLPPAPKGPAP